MSPANFRNETFSSVDATWLRLDTPTNLASITGVLTFDNQMDIDRLKELIEKRLLAHPRFSQLACETDGLLGRPRWEVAPEFDMDYHVQQISLPEPRDRTRATSGRY